MLSRLRAFFRHWRVLLALAVFFSFWWWQARQYVPQPKAVVSRPSDFKPMEFSPNGDALFGVVQRDHRAQFIWVSPSSGETVVRHALGDAVGTVYALHMDLATQCFGCECEMPPIKTKTGTWWREHLTFQLFDLKSGVTLFPKTLFDLALIDDVSDVDRAADGTWIAAGRGPSWLPGPRAAVCRLNARGAGVKRLPIDCRRLHLHSDGKRLVGLKDSDARLAVWRLLEPGSPTMLDSGWLGYADGASWCVDPDRPSLRREFSWHIQGETLTVAGFLYTPSQTKQGHNDKALLVRRWDLTNGKKTSEKKLEGDWKWSERQTPFLFLQETKADCRCYDALADVMTTLPVRETANSGHLDPYAFYGRDLIFVNRHRTTPPNPLPAWAKEFLKIEDNGDSERWVDVYERGTARLVSRVPRSDVLLLDPPQKQVVTRGPQGIEIWDFPIAGPPHPLYLLCAGVPALSLLGLLSYARFPQRSVAERYPVPAASPNAGEAATEEPASGDASALAEPHQAGLEPISSVPPDPGSGGANPSGID